MKVFSPSAAVFFDPELRDAYEASGTWPDDGVEVLEEVFVECVNARGAGKIVIAGPDGQPFIADPPPPSVEDLTTSALWLRDQKMATAASVIALMQDAVDLDMATDVEKASLIKWKRYRVELSRIAQQGGFPQSIEWPTPPETAQTTTTAT